MTEPQNSQVVQTVLSAFEQQLVTFLDQQYHLTGQILSGEKALKDYGIPIKKYENALNNPAVKEALIERGVVFERFEPDNWFSRSLTPVQLLLANALLDTTDTRTNKKKCQDYGVSTVKYEAWLKDPVFKDYLMKRAEQKLGDASHEADLALLDRIRSGDMKAISYYNEMTGRYTQASARGHTAFDINQFVTNVLEIIDENVTNSEDKMAVGLALRKLVSMRNAANIITGASEENDAIVIPEVAALGELPGSDSNGPIAS